MSKIFAVSVELDAPEDVESAQVRYLDGLLKENRDQELGLFAVRFQYDLDGTSHWEGDLMILDVSDGICSLRYANSNDTTEHVSLREYRHRIKQAIAILKARSFIVEIDTPWSKLRGKDLQEALELFKVARIMDS